MLFFDLTKGQSIGGKEADAFVGKISIVIVAAQGVGKTIARELLKAQVVGECSFILTIHLRDIASSGNV